MNYLFYIHNTRPMIVLDILEVGEFFQASSLDDLQFKVLLKSTS